MHRREERGREAGCYGGRMKLSSILSILLALIVALVLAWLVLSKEGGCDRTPDEDPRPACKPGDKDCANVDAPAPTPTPPIGGKK